MSQRAPAQWASVCSGSLLLGKAGLLVGRRATTHWGWLKHLASFGAEPVKERVVIDHKVMTAAGVSSGIDMALTLWRSLPMNRPPKPFSWRSSTTRGRPSMPGHPQRLQAG